MAQRTATSAWPEVSPSRVVVGVRARDAASGATSAAATAASANDRVLLTSVPVQPAAMAISRVGASDLAPLDVWRLHVMKVAMADEAMSQTMVE
jgi:hypothetical protein